MERQYLRPSVLPDLYAVAAHLFRYIDARADVAEAGIERGHHFEGIPPLEVARCHIIAGQQMRTGDLFPRRVREAHTRLGRMLWSAVAENGEPEIKAPSEAAINAFHVVYPNHIIVRL
jgi:hypothetical protein